VTTFFEEFFLPFLFDLVDVDGLEELIYLLYDLGVVLLHEVFQGADLRVVLPLRLELTFLKFQPLINEHLIKV